jgi:hypothetical protein
MKKLIIIFLLLAAPATGNAAPDNISVSGDVSQGASITIEGTGFGSKPTPAPVLWDTVDNQSSYSGVSGGGEVPVGGANPWGLNGYSWGVAQGGGPMLINRTSGDQRNTNSDASYYRLNTNLSVLRNRGAASTGKIYLSYWSKYSASPSTDSTSLKLTRIGDSSSSGFAKTFTWAKSQTYTANGSTYCNTTYNPAHNNSWTGTPGAWNFNELVFDNSTRTYAVYINGSLYSSSEWSSSCGLTFDTVQHFGWEGNTSTSKKADVYFDDIYFDNSFSKVMLCEGDVWANRGQCELQPPTSWAATSISATVNTGDFAAESTAYLYVVDADGTANSLGRAVEIGATGSTPVDTTPPVRSLLAPSGSLSAGTTSTNMSLVTDKAATCRYSTTAGTAYASMTNTFDTSFATSHLKGVTGLSNGGSYDYHVRCINGSGYANTDDATISFSVASSAGTAGSLSWQQENYVAVRADGRIPINVVRTGGSTGTVTAQWSSNGQTARHDTDYYGNDNVTVTFADGVTSVPINTYGSGADGIEMIANGATEDRFFQMILSNPTGGATLGSPSTAIVTIEGAGALLGTPFRAGSTPLRAGTTPIRVQ